MQNRNCLGEAAPSISARTTNFQKIPNMVLTAPLLSTKEEHPYQRMVAVATGTASFCVLKRLATENSGGQKRIVDGRIVLANLTPPSQSSLPTSTKFPYGCPSAPILHEGRRPINGWSLMPSGPWRAPQSDKTSS